MGSIILFLGALLIKAGEEGARFIAVELQNNGNCSHYFKGSENWTCCWDLSDDETVNRLSRILFTRVENIPFVNNVAQWFEVVFQPGQACLNIVPALI